MTDKQFAWIRAILMVMLVLLWGIFILSFKVNAQPAPQDTPELITWEWE